VNRSRMWAAYVDCGALALTKLRREKEPAKLSAVEWASVAAYAVDQAGLDLSEEILDAAEDQFDEVVGSLILPPAAPAQSGGFQSQPIYPPGMPSNFVVPLPGKMERLTERPPAPPKRTLTRFSHVGQLILREYATLVLSEGATEAKDVQVAKVFAPDGAEVFSGDWLDANEWASAHKEDDFPPCPTCCSIGGGFGPSHDGSRFCQSGSIASGGTRSHCTCGSCF
jgi:hypothetical protein